MPDAPPHRRRTTPEGAQEAPREEKKQGPPKPPGKPISVLQERLNKFFGGLALPFMAAGDVHCATVIAQRGPIVAEAWANLAAESPAVKAALESLLRGGAWAGAIGSTAALVIPIAAHHGAPIPDPITAIILGEAPPPRRTAEPVSADEPIVTHTGTPHTNGNVPPPPSDLTNPGAYPGVHNAPIESD